MVLKGSIFKINMGIVGKDVRMYYAEHKKNPEYIIMSYETVKLIDEFNSFHNDEEMISTFYGVQILLDNTLQLGDYKIVG